jgi:hypothetical protein
MRHLLALLYRRGWVEKNSPLPTNIVEEGMVCSIVHLIEISNPKLKFLSNPSHRSCQYNILSATAVIDRLERWRKPEWTTFLFHIHVKQNKDGRWNRKGRKRYSASGATINKLTNNVSVIFRMTNTKNKSVFNITNYRITGIFPTQKRNYSSFEAKL